jgi:hypothetical protein
MFRCASARTDLGALSFVDLKVLLVNSFPFLNGTIFRIFRNRIDVPLRFYRTRIGSSHHLERSKHA